MFPMVVSKAGIECSKVQIRESLKLIDNISRAVKCWYVICLVTYNSTGPNHTMYPCNELSYTLSSQKLCYGMDGVMFLKDAYKLLHFSWPTCDVTTPLNVTTLCSADFEFVIQLCGHDCNST